MEDIRTYYQAADVCVVPLKLARGVQNKILEAMAMGVPVVATKVGGIPELITHEKTGILCDPGDVDNILEKVLNLLSNKNQRLELAANAYRTVVGRFSFDRRLSTIEKFYKDLLNLYK